MSWKIDLKDRQEKDAPHVFSGRNVFSSADKMQNFAAFKGSAWENATLSLKWS